MSPSRPVSPLNCWGVTGLCKCSMALTEVQLPVAVTHRLPDTSSLFLRVELVNRAGCCVPQPAPQEFLLAGAAACVQTESISPFLQPSSRTPPPLIYCYSVLSIALLPLLSPFTLKTVTRVTHEWHDVAPHPQPCNSRPLHFKWKDTLSLSSSLPSAHLPITPLTVTPGAPFSCCLLSFHLCHRPPPSAFLRAVFFCFFFFSIWKILPLDTC